MDVTLLVALIASQSGRSDILESVVEVPEKEDLRFTGEM